MNKYKKIILFYPAYEKGGATKVLINLVNFIQKKNFFIDLLSLNAGYENFKKTKYLKIINLDKKKQKNLRKNRLLYNLYSIFELIKLLKKNDNKKTILFSMQSHLIPSIIGKLFGFKIVIRNSEDPFGATKYAENKFSSVLVFLSKFISFNLSDKIITNASKSFHSIKFFLIDKSKVRIIFNPYIKKNNFKRIQYKRKKQFLAVGRFAKQKNFIFLIQVFSEIFKKIKNYKLVLVGSGSEKNQIIKKIQSLKMQKNIRIKSWSNDLSKDFKTSRIFILPSLYEGCPNILIDAISYKIPCISSNCSGASDILKNNKAGLIYPINDKQKLIKNIFKILKNYNHFNKAADIFSKTKNRFLIDKQSEKYFKFLIN